MPVPRARPLQPSSAAQPRADHPAARHGDELGRLLSEGRYDAAAEIVRRLQREHEAAGDGDASTAETLAAAYRLCLSCDAYRSEGESHQRAARTAGDLERGLRDRLLVLLELPARAPAASDDAAPAQPESRLAVYCLGPLQVYRDHRDLGPLPGRRVRAVLQYLVAHRASPVPREVLMDRFWPEATASAARNNLNVAVHGLRRYLNDSRGVRFADGCYTLQPDLWVDIEEFERLLASARRAERSGDREAAAHAWKAAEALYRGPLFEDDPYEEWILARRRALQDAYLAALERLAASDWSGGDWMACIAACTKILQIQPYREGAHRDLMRFYARHGLHEFALRQYHECAQALRSALDATPSPETTDLYERIRRHEPV